MVRLDCAAVKYCCLLCRGALRHWMTYPRDYERPQDERSYEIYWCDACNFGQIQPRPSQEEVDRFYENYYTHTPGAGRGARESRGPLERLRERIAWWFDHSSDMDAGFIHRLVDGRPSRICDLGCGDGTLIQNLRERGHDVVGVEPDPVTLQLAAKRGLTVHHGHAENPPPAIERGAYDVVVMCHVLHLCLDPARVMRNARALLRPGGLLVCETTNNEAAGLHQQGASWRWLDMPRHVDLFTAASLERVVAAGGLEVRRIEFTGYTRQFKRAWLDEQGRKRGMLFPARGPSRVQQALQAWALLARTLFAKARRKYDSVRVVAQA